VADHTLHHYSATLERIVDGDTIDVLLDLGFKVFTHQRLRLLAIDTPERGQPGYLEATHELAELLAPDGRQQPLIVHTIKRDGFGRWLADVWVEGSDTSINEQMIERGHARD
jgi:micrococcal nuclease